MNAALRTLLTRLVDYAGLFPPAKLGMDEAVANYARYVASEERWMLARFISPVARLAEFESAAKNRIESGQEWALSVLPGADIRADLESIDSFNHRNRHRARIDTIEAKAGSLEAVRALDRDVPDEIALFIEVPADDDPGPLVSEIASVGRFAKIRTGGVTPDAFLSPENIIRFIRRCHESDVPFKATAGLHHPLRCVRPLTYEADAPKGPMNGFINLFLAAALVRSDLSDTSLVELLLTEDPGEFSFQNDAIGWREISVDSTSLAHTRRELAISFGSCSFEEPVADLRKLSWLD